MPSPVFVGRGLSPLRDAEKIADLLLTPAWHIPRFTRHNLLRESGFQAHVTPDPLSVTITFCGHPPEKHPPIVAAFLARCKRVMVESLRAGLTREGGNVAAQSNPAAANSLGL